MKRIWFVAVPLALFALTWWDMDFKTAIAIALISFISATAAYLIALRLNFRWANVFAAAMAFGGLVIYGYAEHRLRTHAYEIDPSADPFATATCPPDGCRMIVTEPEPKPEPEIYP